MGTDKKLSNLETQPLSLSAFDAAIEAMADRVSGVKLEPEYVLLPLPGFAGEVISDLYVEFVAVEWEGGGLVWEIRQVEIKGANDA